MAVILLAIIIENVTTIDLPWWTYVVLVLLS